jgi:multidrug efflux pump subunit AcrA (membrane-fusion protein)
MSFKEKYQGKFTVLLPVLLVMSAVGIMVYLSKFKEPKSVKKDVLVPRYVAAIPVKYQSSNTTLMAFGKVTSAQSIQLVAEASGKLCNGNIILKKANRFFKNDLLYTIENTELKLTIQSQKSDFMNLVASSMSDFKIDFPESFQQWDNYWQQLDVNKILPDLPESKSKKEKAFISNRKLLSMYYTIKSLEEKLGKYTYYAPYSGSIADLKVEAGTVVNAGTPIGRIIRTDEMEAEIPVKSEMISWIRKGMKVFLSSQDQMMKWKGTVLRISDFVDPVSQSVNIYVQIKPNPKFQILEGMYVTAAFNTNAFHGVMELPRKALVNKDMVYVVSEGKLALRQINIHKLNEESFLFSGLRIGELVVNESLINVAEGDQVKVK